MLKEMEAGGMCLEADAGKMSPSLDPLWKIAPAQ
jgi:hypothetical protein